jgi:hypothetical protein
LNARNCFGIASRDSGQSRVPVPPARMIGVIGAGMSFDYHYGAARLGGMVLMDSFRAVLRG